MNRSLTNVLFGGIAPAAQSETQIEGKITKTSIDETVDSLVNAESVIIVCIHYTYQERFFFFHNCPPLVLFPVN